MNFNPCIIIPIYNHGATIADQLAELESLALPCLVVDDGSDEATRNLLEELGQQLDFVTLFHLYHNQGKGAAVLRGIFEAKALGFSHALQVDADGQHDLADIPQMLAEARQQPAALISGWPQYGEDVPKSRFYSRYLTHLWVWIETLSLTIKDSMCGFRVYPLDAVIELVKNQPLGLRMDFDIEVMVRLYWRGVAMVFIPTRVRYPEHGVSHFALIKDNVRISWMHTRLVFGMLKRLPRLLRAKLLNKRGPTHNSAGHWSELKENGSYWGMALSLWCYRHLGRRFLGLLLYPIITYFFLTNREARKQSISFLEKVYWHTAAQSKTTQATMALSTPPVFNVRPGWRQSFQHFMAFGDSIIDRIGAWSGDIQRDTLNFENRDDLLKVVQTGRGAVIVVSHLGNTEMMRALVDSVPGIKMNVLVFSDHAEHISRMMKRINSRVDIELIKISTLDPGTAILLSDKINNGEFVVVSADRTSPNSPERVIHAPFLGHDAPFPQGVFILAALLECPLYLLFCLKEKGEQNVYFDKFTDILLLPRKQRQQLLQECINQYAERLEYYCCKAPLQWFNFYDFWQDSSETTTR